MAKNRETRTLNADTPLYFAAGTVTNLGSATIYYGGSDVDSGDTGLTAGSSVALTVGRHFISETNPGLVQIDQSIATGDDFTVEGNLTVTGGAEVDGALNHDGSTVGFYATAPVAQQAAVTAGDEAHSTTGAGTVDVATVDAALDALGASINEIKAVLEGLGLTAS